MSYKTCFPVKTHSIPENTKFCEAITVASGHNDCVKHDLDLYNNQQLSSKMKVSPTVNHDDTLGLPWPLHDFQESLLFLFDNHTFAWRHDIEWVLTVSLGWNSHTQI